ncbi:hypothetical protein CKO15_06700 [Halorhodospira abdelmalekii]|uniref:CheR family methyltransferase n=1 Tax=Halorhodospira abdelmalekii TaxID=421629 RepID=UPI0019048F14|nr:CheR family methyltransferase [Halorhodospira abdelmalekii]MBK1734976.1 hypothetical protein [Halorhodospira abdelmalekii]
MVLGTVPPHYLARYCLRGKGPQAGTFLVDRRLRERVDFRQINLNRPLPQLPTFYLIMLRNLLIYFDRTTRQEVVRRVLERLEPGGYLMIGHSESLHELGVAELVQLAPAIFRKSLPGSGADVRLISADEEDTPGHRGREGRA